MRTIIAPLDESVVRSLKLGDVVFMNGPIVTGRDEVHIRALEYAKEGKEVPDCLNGAVLFHCGPIMKQNDDGSWTPIAAGPTTSARMNKLEPEMIRRFGIRAIVGKGGMDRATAEAMKECGCVYLAATGGAAVTIADSFTVTGVEWADLGMAESIWKLDTNRFGPLVVAIDAQGNSLYDQVNASLKRD